MTDEVRAAGAVLWREGSDGVEVLAVHRARYDDWSFPKGKQDAGEHILLTAVREVAEETGIRAALGRRLPSSRYQARGRPKVVDYWAGQPATTAAFTPNDEVDAFAWLPVAAARERLSYPRDAGLLAAFLAGPARSAGVTFLRHAAAVNKSAWRDSGQDDLARPLSGYGRAQAQALSQILDCYQTAHVVTSGAERCLATVRPYAALTGAAIETEPAFAVGGPASAGAARQRISDIAASEKPVIVCAHRENLPLLIGWACQQLGAPVPQGPPLQLGDFLVLQAAGGRLVSAEQHRVTALAKTRRSPGSAAAHPRRSAATASARARCHR